MAHHVPATFLDGTFTQTLDVPDCEQSSPRLLLYTLASIRYSCQSEIPDFSSWTDNLGSSQPILCNASTMIRLAWSSPSISASPSAISCCIRPRA